MNFIVRLVQDIGVEKISGLVYIIHYSCKLKLTDKMVNKIIAFDYDIIVSKLMASRHEVTSGLKNLDILRTAIHRFLPEYNKGFEMYFLNNIFLLVVFYLQEKWFRN